MPELPEVEIVCRGLNQLTLDRRIEGGQVWCDRTLAHPSSVPEFWEGMQGAHLTQWYRRGKYLLGQLSCGTRAGGWLGVHLRMTGQLLWLSATAPLHKHTRVSLRFQSGQELRFVDQRRFGQVWWVPPSSCPEKVISGLAKLGPEPLSEGFSGAYLREALQGSQRPIKTALLDQAVVAGLGNIYVDEALFVGGIHPQTRCREIAAGEWEGLKEAIATVLEQSLTKGGTTFSTFLNVQGVNGNYGGVAWVYHRTGQPCRRCGTLIERVKLAGRSSHFCPHCQSWRK